MVEFKGELPLELENARSLSGDACGKMTGKTLGKLTGKMTGKTPDIILDLLREEPSLTIAEIAVTISKSESAVQRCILELQALGRLCRTGTRKNGLWNVLENSDGLKGESSKNIPTKMTGKTLGKMTGKTLGKMTGETADIILDLLRKTPSLTTAGIAVEISKSESTVRRCIHKLQATGHLIRVGSRKTGHWKVNNS